MATSEQPPLAQLDEQRPPSRLFSGDVRAATPSASAVRRAATPGSRVARLPLVSSSLYRSASDVAAPTHSDELLVTSNVTDDDQREDGGHRRQELLLESLRHRKAAKIQRQWRSLLCARREAKHVRVVQHLARLNEAAMFIQQWYRIIRAKRRAGIASLFRTHPVHKLRPDTLPVRRKKAADAIWAKQEAALRELACCDTRQFWQQTDFKRLSRQLVERRPRLAGRHTREREVGRPGAADDTVLVPYQGAWVTPDEAHRAREAAFERLQALRHSRAYNRRNNPEVPSGRYELRVTAKRPTSLPPLPCAAASAPNPDSRRAVRRRVVAAKQWNSSPWLGDAPWAEEPRHAHKRRHQSRLADL